MKQAKTYDEIKPLIELCKAGKLFDVQAWISEGKPVNPPLPETGKARKKSPLEIAIETGFHSMVHVLLQGGAVGDQSHYNPLRHALWKRRLDLVELLVNHGADIHSVNMHEAFETWNNDIVRLFIQKGADLDTGQPLASALCSKIRPALGIFKQYEDLFPSFREQVNVALRYHCREGNLKWVSLMLWAGGDPYTRGPYSPGDSPDIEEDSSALELAALYDHIEIFRLKAIRLNLHKQYPYELIRGACWNNNADLLKMLLDSGYDPLTLEDRGSSLIQSLVSTMIWDSHFFRGITEEKSIDTSDSREKIKMIHMLVRKGARWEPKNKHDISCIRRSFLKMKSDYLMEFIWIMSEYKACAPEAIVELVKTPSMRTLISNNHNRYCELISAMA